MNTIYLISCLVLALISLYMIFAQCYDDGIVGKLAAGAIFIGAFSAVWHGWVDGKLFMPKDVAVLVGGVVIFMGRHLMRFWGHARRCKK